MVDGHGPYPIGGYHLDACKDEIETAVELTLGVPAPVRWVGTCEEAGAMEDGTYILTRAHGGLRKATIDGEAVWTRTLLKKVALRTQELADQLPAVVRGSAPVKENADV
ncbi:hypothetical protein [Arthrobacter sp. ES3-54]|uniref:hypothetical protein n=1 Tax=Arthrobacter sp. ES3-54 TaxID=1502991 RepID=UPI0024052174|nr:hypothetical protein [Arthrobacter sp. ES3-54]MDF9749546.1 hypothetical protein [Arthrobacter sp. ES3-54]